MSQSHTHLCLSFHRAYARLRIQLDEELGTYHGIDLDDFALLHSLAGREDDTAGLESIAADLGTSCSALLRRLRPLEKTGLLAYSSGIRGRRIALRRPGLSLIKTARDTIERVCARPSLSGGLEKLGPALHESGVCD